MRTKSHIYCDWLHQGWGNRIGIWWQTRKDTEESIQVRADGHRRGIQEGDSILTRMQSGKIMRFVVKSIRYERDPTDMFFADLEATDYYDGDQAKAEEEERKQGTTHPFLLP